MLEYPICYVEQTTIDIFNQRIIYVCIGSCCVDVIDSYFMLILRMEMMLNYLDRQVYVILMEVRTEVKLF